MTNLYDFLRQILAEKDNQDKSQCGPQPVFLTNDQIEWIRHYLQEPEAMIQFKARKTGEERNGEPVYAQDYAIAGEPYEVFTILTEAMVQNGFFADMVIKAAQFFMEHVPKCKHCQDAIGENQMAKKTKNFDYTFKPHK